MKFLIKLFCLLSLVSSFAFSKDVWVMTDDLFGPISQVKNCEFFLGKKFLKCTIPETGRYRVFRVNFFNDYLYFNPTKSSGYYFDTNYYFFVDKVQYSGYFSYVNRYSRYEYAESDAKNGKLFTYTNITEFRINNSYIECSTGDNYGYKSNKCFPACPAGESWDYENEVCYSDCTDKDLNKFGFPNGTAQGGCIDCSNAFGDQEISSCVCAGYGAGLSEKGVYLNLEGNSFVSYNCSDGRDITFKRRSKENPDKDKENPDKDKEKDKNENGNNDNTGEQDNNPSDNNSGGTAGNGSSGGGGSSLGSETKPNPNYKGEEGKEDGKGEEGKQEGKEDGKGKEGKGEDNGVAGRLDYGNLEKDMKDFKGDYSKAVEDSFSFVNDVKTSLSDTISKIKDGNLMSLKKNNIPSSCPLEYKVNLIYFEKELIFDICKAISPASQTLYYFFYFVFFVLLLFAVIKLFILTFMGW